MKTILVTGGAGFIGSHTIVELQQSGYDVVVVDNLSNSSSESLNRVKAITGRPLAFYQMDIRDRAGMERVLSEHPCDACIHFAGLKAVGESVEKPWEYYGTSASGARGGALCVAAPLTFTVNRNGFGKKYYS